MFKKIFSVLYTIIFLFLLFVAGSVAISFFDIPGGYKLYTVKSGSMEPAVKTGSVVVVRPSDEYLPGDVITFVPPEFVRSNNPKETVTHRLVQIIENEGRIQFVTKGDANEDADSETIDRGQVLGKSILTVPYVGYPIAFAKTRDGLIILVVIPATIIIYTELMNIKNEALKLIRERKKRKLTPVEKAEVAVGQEVLEAEKDIKKFFMKKKK